MKKFISIFTSIIMTITLILSCSISALAETEKYWEPKPDCQDITPCVNDVEFGGEIDSSYNPSTEEHLFTYEGEGVVTGWEFPTSKENTDYEIISQKGNSITIKLINENHELPYINALVDFGETESDITQGTADTIENTSTTSEKATQTVTEKQSTAVTSETTTADIIESNNTQNKIIVPYAVLGGIIVVTVMGIILIKKHRA